MRGGECGERREYARLPAAWTSARATTTRSRWTRTASGCTTRRCPTTEAALRQVFDKLARHGRVLVVVDQPASIGALPSRWPGRAGIEVAYLPGLAMRRIADLHPGAAKTDARDAYVIADAARTMPHTLRRVDAGDETLAELEVLVGFDDDLAGEATRMTNRHPGPAHPDPPRPGTGAGPESPAPGRARSCCRAAAARPGCARPAAASCTLDRGRTRPGMGERLRRRRS